MPAVIAVFALGNSDTQAALAGPAADSSDTPVVAVVPVHTRRAVEPAADMPGIEAGAAVPLEVPEGDC
jgi:hypothetical protein